MFNQKKAFKIALEITGYKVEDLAEFLGIGLGGAYYVINCNKLTSERLNLVSEFFSMKPSEFIALGELHN